MIKVHKNQENIPGALHTEKAKHWVKAFKETRQVPQGLSTIYQNVHDQLKTIYKGKCGYCERKVDSLGEIDHYRPVNDGGRKNCEKQAYPWLRFSWSNLVYSCSKCNGRKSNCFPIESKEAYVFDFENDGLNDLHKLASVMNEHEKPLIVHPEIGQPQLDIFFEDGIPKGRTPAMAYTIRLLELDKKEFIEDRQVEVDRLVRDLKRETVYETKPYAETLMKLEVVWNNFIHNCTSPESPFSLWHLHVMNEPAPYIRNHFKEGAWQLILFGTCQGKKKSEITP